MITNSILGIVIALAVALPVARKWELELRKTGPALIVAGLVSALLLSGSHRWVSLPPIADVAFVASMTLMIAVVLLLQRFYRDPDRLPPDRSDVVVSPADGHVVYVREARSGRLPGVTKKGRSYSLDELAGTSFGDGDAILIGIGMTFMDVHVNRSPITGTVVSQKQVPGRFESLRNPEAVFANRRTTTIIKGAGLEVAVVQIASRLVRQIVSWIREGARVDAGDRIGMIRFGSQVDVILPRRPGITVTVSPGQHVVAGETVVALVTADRGARR